MTMMSIIKICNKLIEYSFYLLFFLVPLVVASDTSELFEFNKMWLTFGLTLLIGAAWFTKMIRQRRIWIQRTPLDIFILLFLLSQFIATLFSWDMHVSIWGYYSRFNGGFLSILTYIFLYYAFVSNLAMQTIVKRLLFVSLLSGLVVALWGLPSHFGHDPTCFLFRQTFDVSCWTEDFQPKIRIFSTLGQPAWLAAYLAILLPISIIMFIRFIKNLPLSIFYLLLSALFYLDLLYTQARSGIIAVWLSLAFLTIGYLWISRKKSSIIYFLPSIFVFVVITFFIGTPFSQFSKFTLTGIKSQSTENKIESPKTAITKQDQPKTPEHIQELGGTDSGKIRSIVWKGAIEIWKNNPLFGTGVETFAFAYYRYKPAAQNLVSEWNFLYNKAHNEFLNYLATTGVFGLGTYIIMIVLFLSLALAKVTNIFAKFANRFASVREKQEPISRENTLLVLALVSGYLSILVTNFFGFSVVITNIYLFLIPAFIFILGGMINPQKQFVLPPEAKTVNPSLLERQPTISQWTFIAILLFAICYLLFALLKFWVADKNYAYGYNLDRTGEYQKAYPYLHKAVSLRKEPVFKDELAINDAILAVSLLSQKDLGENKEELQAQANILAQEAIDTSDQLTTAHENNVVFWKTRTRIFYTLSQVDSRYLPQALQAIEKAASLSPNDASISYNLGVLYGQNNNLQKAIEVLENTIKLKPNYQDAYYALGLIYHEESLDKDGTVTNSALQQKAIDKMHYIIDHFPNNSGAKDALKSWEKK